LESQYGFRRPSGPLLADRAEPALPTRSLGRRVLTGLGSQGLSSVSNFALVVVVARTSTPREFGAFSIAYSLALLTIVGIRGAVGETLSVMIHDRSDGAAALGASLLIGTATGLTVGLLGILWPEPGLKPWLLSFAVGLPLLAMQDAGRFVGFASGRPGVAALSDGIWLTLQVVLWLAFAASGALTGISALMGWWLSAGIAALMVSGVTRRPAILAGWHWLKRYRPVASSFGSETMISLSGNQAAIYALGFVAGFPAAGALRAAQSLYGPVRSFSAGIASVALPEASQRWSTGGREAMLGYLRRVSVGVTAMSIVALTALSALPEGLGRGLLDDTWPAAQTVMLPVGVGVVAGAVTVGAHLGLRAVQSTVTLVVLRTATTALTVTGGVGGAAVAGLRGAAHGLAGAFVLTAAASWMALLSYLNRQAT
jgi:O-antigen/teichoic acid export membrane protein